jgi:DNA-binding MarR family transcriptional regulator
MQMTSRKKRATGAARTQSTQKRAAATSARTPQGTKARAGSGSKPVGVVEADRWLDTFLPYHMYRVTKKLNARLLKRLKTMRINTSQWRVLSVLRAYGAMSITQIVEATLLEQPTASRVVAQLQRIGHVQRRSSALDSRVTEISMTASGLAAFDDIVPSALRHQGQAFRDVSPRELALLAEILKKVEHNISHED